MNCQYPHLTPSVVSAGLALLGMKDGLNECGVTRPSGDGTKAKPQNICGIKCTSENKQWTMADGMPHTLISNLLEDISEDIFCEKKSGAPHISPF